MWKGESKVTCQVIEGLLLVLGVLTAVISDENYIFDIKYRNIWPGLGSVHR